MKNELIETNKLLEELDGYKDEDEDEDDDEMYNSE